MTLRREYVSNNPYAARQFFKHLDVVPSFEKISTLTQTHIVPASYLLEIILTLNTVQYFITNHIEMVTLGDADLYYKK